MDAVLDALDDDNELVQDDVNFGVDHTLDHVEKVGIGSSASQYTLLVEPLNSWQIIVNEDGSIFHLPNGFPWCFYAFP